jgi:hypothetical protein
LEREKSLLGRVRKMSQMLALENRQDFSKERK